MWELDCEASWMPKNWCFYTVVLEKTLESPLDCKEIQPVHSEGDQPWDFFGRNDAKAETPVLWPPHAKGWLIGKDWCWRDLGEGGEGDDRRWDGWMASLTRWMWVWVNFGSLRWTGRPGVLQFMGSQSWTRLPTELNRTELNQTTKSPTAVNYSSYFSISKNTTENRLKCRFLFPIHKDSVSSLVYAGPRDHIFNNLSARSDTWVILQCYFEKYQVNK